MWKATRGSVRTSMQGMTEMKLTESQRIWLISHIIVATMLGGFGVMVYFNLKREAAFMAECLTDGKKNYECDALYSSRRR